MGRGKVAEIAAAVSDLAIDTVIFDDELSPGQLRNLSRALMSIRGGETGVLARGGVEVRGCDRTALILDIFRQRAATREGQLQVELAQLEYQLPRLTRMWSHLERQSGSGQVKGMGEKQIEIDKRLIRDKIAALKKELQAVRVQRKQRRRLRADKGNI